MKYSRRKLSNGSTLVHLYLPSSPSVTVSAFVQAGFRSDPPNKHGLAHFTEHMLFTGTKKFPSHHTLATSIERFGGWHYAHTWIDYQMHEVCLPHEYFEHGIEILTETFFHPLISKREVEKEKGVVKREILRYQYEMEKLLFYYVWLPLFFQGTKLARPCIGTENEIERFTAQEVQTFIRTNFLPQRIVFIIAGNTSLSRSIELFERFSEAQNSVVYVQSTENLHFRKDHSILIKPYQSEQVAIAVGIKTVSINHQDRHVLELIRNMLSRDFGASLPEKLRSHGGLVYTWSSSQDNLTDTGYLVFTTSTNKENVMLVLKLILEEFKRIEKGKFFLNEVDLAKSNLIGSLQISLESSYAFVQWYGTQELLTPNTISHPKEKIGVYKKISKGDIRKAAKSYFTKDNIYIALLGEVKKSDIEKLLG